MIHPLRAVYRRLGLKDRVLTRCLPGEHDWYRVYGDAIIHTGAMWHCNGCPAHQDHHPDNTTTS